MSSEKKRLYGSDFVRTVCILMIVLHHSALCIESGFDASSAIDFLRFNGQASATLVCFFMLSGSNLFFSHSKVEYGDKLKKFYIKRWKSIFPPFYVAWICCFVMALLTQENYLKKHNPFALILSLLGMDGYFLYRVDTFYLVGEWFMGAIIILYIIYPFFARLYEKYPKVCFTVVLAGSLLPVLDLNWLIYPDRNLFTCLFRFFLGMFFIKYYKLFSSKIAVIASACVWVGLLVFNGQLNEYLLLNLVGITGYVALFGLGERIMTLDFIKKPVMSFSKISFEIILAHQMVGFVVCSVLGIPKLVPTQIITQLIIIVLTILSAKALKLVTGFLQRSLQRKEIVNG